MGEMKNLAFLKEKVGASLQFSQLRPCNRLDLCVKVAEAKLQSVRLLEEDAMLVPGVVAVDSRAISVNTRTQQAILSFFYPLHQFAGLS